MFNRNLKHTLALVSLIGLTGCANNLVGTWRGANDQPRGFNVGGITLAADGTYTAYATYGGDTRGFSGTWKVKGDELLLDDAKRRYFIKQSGDSLKLTEPQTMVATAMERQH